MVLARTQKNWMPSAPDNCRAASRITGKGKSNDVKKICLLFFHRALEYVKGAPDILEFPRQFDQSHSRQLRDTKESFEIGLTQLFAGHAKNFYRGIALVHSFDQVRAVDVA